MNSSSRVFGLKDPIVLIGQQMPAGATHAAPAGTVRPRLRALGAVHKILPEQFMFMMFGDAIRGPSLLGVASIAVVFLWKRIQGGRLAADLGKTETEPVRLQAKSLKNVPTSGPTVCDGVRSPASNRDVSKRSRPPTIPSKGLICQS